MKIKIHHDSKRNGIEGRENNDSKKTGGSEEKPSKGAKGSKIKTLSQERLKFLIHYDPDSGLFIRRVALSNRTKAGSVAGRNNHGYIMLSVDGNEYLAHRLAWFYVHGSWPTEIDHINHIKSDNRISNLRDGTVAQNAQNRMHAQVNSRSGFLGAFWDNRKKKWVARVVLKKRQYHAGYFKSPMEAHQAYLKKKRELHEFCMI